MSSESTKDRLMKVLENVRRRQAFVAAQLGPNIAAQIRANRESRGWHQEKLAQLSGMKQTQISRLENPNYEQYTLTTLRRLADAFDVGLAVRFVSFPELIEWTAALSKETLIVPSFGKDKIQQAIYPSETSGNPLKAETTDVPVQGDWR